MEPFRRLFSCCIRSKPETSNGLERSPLLPTVANATHYESTLCSPAPKVTDAAQLRDRFEEIVRTSERKMLNMNKRLALNLQGQAGPPGRSSLLSADSNSMSPYGSSTPLPDSHSEEDIDQLSSMMGSTTSLPPAVLNVRLVPREETSNDEEATPVLRGRSREVSYTSRTSPIPEDDGVESTRYPNSESVVQTTPVPGPSTTQRPRFTLQPTALSRSWDSN